MTDRGLRSPKLWEKIRFYGWHPYMRQSINTTFRLDGGMRMPARVERHWPVLSAATPLTLAFGSRVENAQALKRDPSALRLGLAALSRLRAKGRMCRRARLPPEPWPHPSDGVKAVCHPEIRNLPV